MVAVSKTVSQKVRGRFLWMGVAGELSESMGRLGAMVGAEAMREVMVSMGRWMMVGRASGGGRTGLDFK